MSQKTVQSESALCNVTLHKWYKTLTNVGYLHRTMRTGPLQHDYTCSHTHTPSPPTSLPVLDIVSAVYILCSECCSDLQDTTGVISHSYTEREREREPNANYTIHYSTLNTIVTYFLSEYLMFIGTNIAKKRMVQRKKNILPQKFLQAKE